MQRVIHKDGYKNIHPLLDEIELFYQEVSSFEPKPKMLISNEFDISFKYLADTFIEYSSIMEENVPKIFIDKHIQPMQLPEYNKNNIIICFSGGKDSIALALKCMNKGYNVYLYSVEHINQSYLDEIEHAKKAAEYLNLPLYVDDIRVGGHNSWMEHPMKNMIIANGALTYGIRNNIGTRIWFGNYSSSLLDDNDFSRCAGDCVDMWDRYNVIIQRIIPDFHIETDLETMGETLEIITPNKELLNLSLSCLCRHSLRDYRWNWVKEKFGIELPKNRCGSCYKCCVEYIYMADHDLIEFNRDYYRYCINSLYHVYLNETGPTLDINNVWYSYMFYDIKESKIVEDMKEARMFIRNIKWGDEYIVQNNK